MSKGKQRRSSTSSSASYSSERRSATTTASSTSAIENNNVINNNKNSRSTSESSKRVANTATTTLEISSYTSDSLFNSHFILTPMISDSMFSPSTQLASLLLKSPLLQPNSPNTRAASTRALQQIHTSNSNSLSFNSFTQQQKRQLPSNSNDESFVSLTNTSTKPPFRSPLLTVNSPSAFLTSQPQQDITPYKFNLIYYFKMKYLVLKKIFLSLF